MHPIVDSHCHLNDTALIGQVDKVVDRARRAGLVRMVTVGTSVDEFDTVINLADRFDEVYAALGLHPQIANQPIEIETLIDLAKHPKVVGIGETGFDLFYDCAPFADQELCFRKHIRAAIETDLPLIVHTRDAEADTIRVLKEETKGCPGRLKGVIHCYSSARVLAEEAIELGFYISLSGILTFKKSQDLRDTVKDLPCDKLLVETDSPYLAPPPHRGQTCEPAYVVDTARVMAEVKGMTLDDMADQTTRNFFTLFKKVKPL